MKPKYKPGDIVRVWLGEYEDTLVHILTVQEDYYEVVEWSNEHQMQMFGELYFDQDNHELYGIS